MPLYCWLFFILTTRFYTFRGCILRGAPTERCTGMKQEDIDRIDDLRRESLGYKRIAAITGFSLDTIKSHCKRHPLTEIGSEVRCKLCGVLVEQTPLRKKKLFCSDRCRMAWWNAHPEQGKRKTRTLTCICCEQPFQSSKARKFCSRACYADYRRKNV